MIQYGQAHGTLVRIAEPSLLACIRSMIVDENFFKIQLRIFVSLVTNVSETRRLC